ncbi:MULTISPECIES: hypothetical protein [unclassified Providencia]|uniref:hypothetical protein n=1 Tax=unclassified Providencia TaxID=2633465 RepID=UPI002349DC77|nr:MULTISPECIES: hypothetical protein [unclassified Providencia]
MRKYLLLLLACASFMASANNGYMNYYEQENRDPLSKDNPNSYKNFQEKMNKSNPDDEFCLKVDAELYSSEFLISSCIDKNIPKLNDRQSPASEIAMAVVYQCAPEVKWSLKSYYEKTKCKMSAETGQPLSYWKRPFNETEMMDLINQSTYKKALVKVLEFRKKRK